MKKVLILFTIFLCIIAIVMYVAGYIFVENPKKSKVKVVSVISRAEADMIKIQNLRHATILFSTSGKKILVDPYLADQGELPPFPLTSPRMRNPLVPLPVKADDLKDVDAVLITHYHSDHIDKAAKDILSKDTLVFCQPADEKNLKHDGFNNIKVITSSIEWQGLTISRFDANHGFGMIGKILGKSSSYAIETACGSVFFTGDAVYDEILENNLKENKPDIVIANAGSAKFIFGQPITLRDVDIEKVANLLPESKIILDHLDAVNHCQQSSAYLKDYFAKKDFINRIYVPQDGDVLTFQ